ncbi:MAG: hypothetical protein KBS95_02415 [Alistipes sp.]|nr:hypothetical protein [Candidatus Alistipes equi]
MNILIYTPTSREQEYMRDTLKNAGQLKNNYIISHRAMGKAGAATALTKSILEAKVHIDRIVDIGYAAGSLGFHQGDFVVPKVARYHDAHVPDGFIPEITNPYPLDGRDDITIFTGDSFVDKTSIDEINHRFNTKKAIYDMEATALAIAADIMGNIPVTVLKLISDVPQDGHSEMTYEEFANTHKDFSIFLDYMEKM